MGLFSQLTAALRTVNTSSGRVRISRLLSCTQTNDNALPGNIGEFFQSLVASISAVALTSGTVANVTSISLTAGDWDVEGMVSLKYIGATQTNDGQGGISTTSATITNDGSQAMSGIRLTTTSCVDSITPLKKRISLAATTTVYLVAQATFSAGSASAFGGICARRVR